MIGIRTATFWLAAALPVLTLCACSKPPADQPVSPMPEVAPIAATPEAPASATPAAPPAPDNVETLSGAKFTSFPGDAARGEKNFIVCKSCHAAEKNGIGPMLKGIVRANAGSAPGYGYSAANRNSGIRWTPEKLFQYLEKPQRVVPGTKMTYPGVPDPQQRADIIAYLATLQ